MGSSFLMYNFIFPSAILRQNFDCCSAAAVLAMVWYPWRGALSAAGGMLSRLGTARQAHAARRDDDTGLLRSFNWLTLFLVHCLRSPPPLLPPPALAGGSWGWERPVNILCMDGGGIRGRNLLVMVEEIERMCGQPVSELFDLVTPTLNPNLPRPTPTLPHPTPTYPTLSRPSPPDPTLQPPHPTLTPP